MPVAQKKCKKVIKKEQAQIVQQPVFMPIIQKTVVKKVDDESVPTQVNESFDYSMTDPLEDDIYIEEASNTGVTSIKNNMF